MNTIKLENTLLQFIYKNGLTSKLVNGVTIKIIAMMYNNRIDYYYSDLLATALDVPIKFVDNIYLRNQSKYYNKPLQELLLKTEYKGTPEEANKLEEDVKHILKTKKKIHYKHFTHKGSGKK